MTLAGPRVRVCWNDEIMSEYTLGVARQVAEDILADPNPVLSRDKADTLARELLTICDALSQ